jgi:parallel beta-helix repeat protein
MRLQVAVERTSTLFSRAPRFITFVLLLSASGVVSPLAAQLATTCSSPGQPILNVPASYPTIQSAVNASTNGACILVAPGTYFENIEIDGRYIELKAASPDVTQTVIDGARRWCVVVFQQVPYNPAVPYVPAARISGFTIQNGLSAPGQGGGITLANQAEVFVENNVIKNNTSGSDGGGILVFNLSHATIRNNTITANAAPRYGGGMFVVGDASNSPAGGSNPIIYGNTITNNRTTGVVVPNGGSSGGGILVAGYSAPSIVANTITGNTVPFAGGGVFLGLGSGAFVEENTINNNSAAYGGGIHIETSGAAVVIRSNTISSNQAVSNASFSGVGFGGGISVYGQSIPSILYNTISSNTATYGGGGVVVAEGANATIRANTISSNLVNGNAAISPVGPPPGGGIYVSDATANIVNNLIYSNTSGYGGGIGLVGGGTAPTVVNIQNNTIVKNTANVIPGSAPAPGGGGLFIPLTASCTPTTSTTVTSNIFDLNNGFQIFEACKGGATYVNNLVNNFSNGMYFNYTSHTITDIASFNAGVNGAGNVSGSTGFVNTGGNDFRLTAGSAAIDRGSSSGAPAEDYASMDRPAGSGFDIGAYEFTNQTVAKGPVFEFYSLIYQGHFFTQSKDEKNFVLSSFPYRAYRYYGTAFNAYPSQLAGTVPVYRFFSAGYLGHYYTPSLCEMYTDCQLHPAGDPHAIYPNNVFQFINVAFYVYPNQVPGSTPVYWFFSPVVFHHFFTNHESEKDFLLTNPTSLQWTYEGPKWYVPGPN